jgi:hypothetical protein
VEYPSYALDGVTASTVMLNRDGTKSGMNYFEQDNVFSRLIGQEQ